MPVEIAKTAGFCFGVNRAVKILEEMTDKGEKVCTLGPIIHNPQVIDDFKNRGVRIIDSPDEADKDSTVVIRAHGITVQTRQRLDELGIKYVDTTCPYVMKIHKIVGENTNEKNVLLIAGDDRHPEVCGFRSVAKGASYVIKTLEEAEQLFEGNKELFQKEIILVFQTTFSVEEGKKILKFLKKVCTKAIYFDTICKATQNRQQEALEMSKHCDAMIVVGGHFSSNTVKLRSVCEKNCPTFLIENAKELYDIDLSAFRLIGVTAGASTPARIIKEVHITMSEILNNENKTSDDIYFVKAMEENSEGAVNTEAHVEGIVVGMTPSEIQVDTGRKYAGFVPAEEYSNDPSADYQKELKIGDKIDLIIMKTNDSEGTMMLSKRRFDDKNAWEKIVEAYDNKEILEATIAQAVKGGVLAYPKGVRVFIPGSLLGVPKGSELSDSVGQTVKLLIIEADKQKKRAVGSVRAARNIERSESFEKVWQDAEEGKEYIGTVKSIVPYGAFVDIGGAEGMVHISELSWKRIKNPSEVVSVGDEIKVYIKALIEEDGKRKISLGYKTADTNPWEIFIRNNEVGSVIDVKIVRFCTFGAFAEISEGLEGLIHISQIANRHIASPKDELTIGEVVKAKVIGIDTEKKHVNLSIRALLEDDEPVEAAEEAVEEEAAPAAEEAAEEATEE